jgi:hypothetical protein
LRSADEHPLRMRGLRPFLSGFSGVDLHFFHFTSIGTALLVERAGFTVALKAADAIDRLLLAIPPMRRFAWIVVLDLRA